MKLRPLFGVMALAMLLTLAGAYTLMAGEDSLLANSNERCVMVNGQCVPSDGVAGTSSGSLINATFANATATTAPVGAGCEGPCVPMTPEECAAAGFDPSGCMTAGTGSLTGAANARLTSAELSPIGPGPFTREECAALGISSATGSGATCAPSQGCGSASTIALVGVRNPQTGEVTFVTMPLSEAQELMASARSKPTKSDI